MTDLYDVDAITNGSLVDMYGNISSELNYIPGILLMLIIYVAVFYYSKDNGIYKAQITASGVTVGFTILLSLIGMVAIELMFVPLGFMILGILLSIFLGDE